MAVLRGRSVGREEHLTTIKDAVLAPSTRFFADTSFVLALGGLSISARTEARRWIDSIGIDRFHIPAWVAHEVYLKTTSETQAVIPLATAANSFLSAALQMQVEATRFVDDLTLKGLGKDRIAFLGELDATLNAARGMANELTARSKASLDSVSDFLATLVSKYVIADSDFYSRLSHMEAEHSVRLMGRHPPGFQDSKKEKNRYGDLIIWREVVERCRGQMPSAVVLCTNDHKPDWVYTPPTIIDAAGKGNNIVEDGVRVVLPHPLLAHELAQACPNAELHIVNLATVAWAINQATPGAPSLRAAYQPVARQTEPPTDRRQPERPPSNQGNRRRKADASPAPQTAFSLDAVVRDLESADLERIVRSLGSVKEAIAAEIFPSDKASVVGRAIADAMAAGSEAASIFLQDITSPGDTVSPEAVGLYSGCLEGVYVHADGRLRDRPLAVPTRVLFAPQNDPKFATAIEHLRALLGGHERSYLALPDPSPTQTSLSLVLERIVDGPSKLEDLLSHSTSLIDDANVESENNLTVLAGGSRVATVGELTTILAKYFCVPPQQLDLGKPSFTRISWSPYIGLIDWGPKTGLKLR